MSGKWKIAGWSTSAVETDDGKLINCLTHADARVCVEAHNAAGWRDIDERAKVPCVRVLLYIPAYANGEPVRLGSWDGRCWRTTSGECPADAQPTMYMPLPAPPVPL